MNQSVNPYMLFFCLGLSSAIQSAELVLTVDKIKHVSGNLMIAVYDNKKSWDTNQDILINRIVPVTQTTITITFENLPTTTAKVNYAIKLYQDENSNGALDKNFLGIPSERYGFSNNGGYFGLPSFEKATIKQEQMLITRIHLQ
ncbi:MAG: DUF2141 domain-containing protein [Pseudomonadota bacterium]